MTDNIKNLAPSIDAELATTTNRMAIATSAPEPSIPGQTDLAQDIGNARLDNRNCADVDEAIKAGWREQTHAHISSIVVNPDQVLIRVVAMTAIDYVQNGADKSGDYYEPRLKELGLSASGSKVAMPAATLGTRIDRRSPKDGKEAGKLLDAIASGIDGLVISVGSHFPWAYSDECVSTLIAKVSEIGGLRKLADLARNENIDDNPRGVIRLDGIHSGMSKRLLLQLSNFDISLSRNKCVAKSFLCNDLFRNLLSLDISSFEISFFLNLLEYPISRK